MQASHCTYTYHITHTHCQPKQFDFSNAFSIDSIVAIRQPPYDRTFKLSKFIVHTWSDTVRERGGKRERRGGGTCLDPPLDNVVINFYDIYQV